MDNNIPELEQVVLGAALLEPDSWDRIEHMVQPGLFYDPRNALVAKSILEMRQQNRPVDIITVTHQLMQAGELTGAGGAAYVVELTSKVASSANIEYHTYLLLQAWLKREVARYGHELYGRAPQPTENILDILDEANSKFRLLESTISVGQTRSLADQLDDALRRAEQAASTQSTSVMTGIERLDKLTGGIQPGHVTIVGARPGVGKTAFATSVALGAASLGHPVLFVSLEMLDYQLMWRFISNRARVPHHLLKDSRLTAHQWRQVVSSLGEIGSLPIRVDDSSGLDYRGIRQRVISWRHRLKPSKEPLVIVDYLQLIKGDGNGVKREQIERTSKQMAELAKSERVTILELAQLSRYDKNEKPRAPDMRDLRGSGEIEEDAACIMFLHSDSMYGGGEDYQAEVNRQVIKDKDRFGPTGSVDLYFNKDYQSFSEHPAQAAPVNEEMLARVHFKPGELGREE